MSSRAHWILRDGDRTIAYGRGDVAARGAELLERSGFLGYAVITTARAAASAAAIVAKARVVAIAGHGAVPDVAAGVRGQVSGLPLVALGGGRVIDAAKAIAALERATRPEGVAAIPTTLSGAELTSIHRQLPGDEGRMIRPSLAVCDPELMASQPMPALAASAMNALAHAVEARWNDNGTPLTDALAERAARRLCEGLEPEHPDRDALALGAVEAAYAFGLIGTGVHHIACQTIVRNLGTPHAATNAVILPHACALMATRAPEAIDALDRELGGDAASALRTAAGRAGVTRLRELGHTLDDYRALVPAMLARPDLARTPGVDEQALESLLEAAW